MQPVIAMAPNYDEVIRLIDAAHSEDPKKINVSGKEMPYELHYAQKMSSYLDKREPDASMVLKVAIRAQHFRRWEVPRDSYPMTRVGYHAWRTHLKRRQAQLVASIADGCGFEIDETRKIEALIEKQGLREGDPEAQVLDQHDEDKIVKILQKTWGKMSEKGHQMALDIDMEGDCRKLVEKALAG